MHDVFISYASKDKKIALTICSNLESKGIRSWIAVRDIAPGASYQQSITIAIKSSKAMVLIFSEHANNSDEILKELSLASQYRVPVIPLRLQDIMPNEKYAFELATRQWVDIFNNWEEGLSSVATAIGNILGRSETAPPIRKEMMSNDKYYEYLKYFCVAIVVTLSTFALLKPTTQDVYHASGEQPTATEKTTSQQAIPGNKNVGKTLTIEKENNPMKQSGSPDVAGEAQQKPVQRITQQEAISTSKDNPQQKKIGSANPAGAAERINTKAQPASALSNSSLFFITDVSVGDQYVGMIIRNARSELGRIGHGAQIQDNAQYTVTISNPMFEKNGPTGSGEYVFSAAMNVKVSDTASGRIFNSFTLTDSQSGRGGDAGAILDSLTRNMGLMLSRKLSSFVN